MKRRLSGTNLSSENNLMMTGAFSWNIGKLFSKLKFVTDNLLFIYAEANLEAIHIANMVLSYSDSLFNTPHGYKIRFAFIHL